MTQSLDYEDFSPQLNTKFTVTLADPDPEDDIPAPQIEMELVDATQKDNPHCVAFSVLFHGGPEQFVPQGTYAMNHPDLGDISLFIVPVGEVREGDEPAPGEEDKRPLKGYKYQANFSRLKTPAEAPPPATPPAA